MRQFCLILIIFFTNIALLAQSVSPSPQKCPTLDVEISPILGKIGETFTAKATITGADEKDIKFNWQVRDGKILRGQGTSKIKVQKTSHNSIVVVAEAIGPGECRSSDSAAEEIAQKSQIFDPFDQYVYFGLSAFQNQFAANERFNLEFVLNAPL
ncbi:MAG TPA: hypothetical protein VF571_20015 [Pyrinomonadaceae bacterium]|jgi:hypothetical protein